MDFCVPLGPEQVTPPWTSGGRGDGEVERGRGGRWTSGGSSISRIYCYGVDGRRRATGMTISTSCWRRQEVEMVIPMEAVAACFCDFRRQTWGGLVESKACWG